MFRRLLTALFVLLPLVAVGQNNPVADPQATIVEGNARFTLLTPWLIRMEWADSGRFTDQASLVFINRRLPAPHFTTDRKNGWLTLTTSGLELRYKTGSGTFTADNLEIRFSVEGRKLVWRYGMPDTANLGGTIRTLDGIDGATPLEPGLLSRDGWVVVDDAERPLFDNSDWPWVVPAPGGDRKDLYFFGYGHEYRKTLHDFTLVAGKIPMPPRFAFGLWWSRYWAYTDQELKELVGEFDTHDVPLDVLVVDMDWHLTFNLRWSNDVRDQAGQRLGWTGYTWDRNYFPDPPGFLSWCEGKGLKTPLNIHPASGIQPHEEVYPAMAKAMGIDPATKKYVPFDIVDKKFATNYMNLVMQPLERMGVDFWWLDWQQWGTTKIPGVTPTWWLNYVFFTDMERRGRKRPLLFHRWGGLGNHRYEIGFSGDVISSWPSLAFQTYFTPTAANVGYGYWSHDIGGHIPGPVSEEMYTRWIQFGIFSPVIRTHTTKNGKAERRIWGFSPAGFTTMRNAILLRYALIPYIYTASRTAYDTGISLCRPMYYDYPGSAEAYAFPHQYMFGDRILVSPVAAPVDTISLRAQKEIWLPEGSWIEWFSGTTLKGPAAIRREFTSDEIPLYVKAGAIIPMQPPMKNTHEQSVDPLILTLFPGPADSIGVYDDEGNSTDYQRNICAWTAVAHTGFGREVKITISPAEGSYPGMPETRRYEIRLPFWWPPESVDCNGAAIVYGGDGAENTWHYDGQKLTTIISLGRFSVHDKVEVNFRISKGLALQTGLLDGVPGKLRRLQAVMPLLDGTWPKEWTPEELLVAAQTGTRIGLHPADALKELTVFPSRLEKSKRAVDSLQLDQSIISRVKARM